MFKEIIGKIKTKINERNQSIEEYHKLLSTSQVINGLLTLPTEINPNNKIDPADIVNNCPDLNDNFDKTRAWFDKTIDISKLKVGTYAIYITNKSNIEDYGELNELLLRDLSTVKTTINSKEYSFSVNKDKRYRIELTVK